MLDHQPRSFYISFPVRALVVHPWREDFNNELLPKLHADLWSDWFLAMREQTGIRLDRVTLQVQSVLGLFGDALALGGLAFVGGPGAWRVVRRRSSGADFPLGLLAFVALGSFIAYVVTLIRLPQDQGDPIKSSYLLFTAPCWAILSVAAWLEVKRRSAIANAVLVAVACLYVVNYALYTFGVFYY
jgi:hypothetical protein